jgi:hypothetical protein
MANEWNHRQHSIHWQNQQDLSAAGCMLIAVPLSSAIYRGKSRGVLTMLPVLSAGELYAFRSEKRQSRYT